MDHEDLQAYPDPRAAQEVMDEMEQMESVEHKESRSEQKVLMWSLPTQTPLSILNRALPVLKAPLGLRD